MSLTKTDITNLISVLGKIGASKGLKYSKYTNNELHKFLSSHEVNVPKKTKRDDLIQLLLLLGSELVNNDYDHLLNMNRLEIKHYFLENDATRAEIAKILDALGLQAPTSSRVSLADFAAQEISDLGMFQRISTGQTRN